MFIYNFKLISKINCASNKLTSLPDKVKRPENISQNPIELLFINKGSAFDWLEKLYWFNIRLTYLLNH